MTGEFLETTAGDFLAGMAASSRVRSAAAQAKLPERELRARLADLPPAPVLKLSGFDLIAEVKLRSPAVGQLKAAEVEDVGARVQALTQGRGVDAVIEMDFTANLGLYPACVRPGATIVVYGMGAAEATVPTYWFMRNRITLGFVFIYEIGEADRAAGLREMDALLREGVLQHTVGLRLPLADIARAHDLVEQGQVLGNVVLEIP